MQKLAQATFINSHSQNAINKRKQTNIEKYGTETPCQNKIVKEKMRKTIMNKYGVEYPIQHPEFSEKACTSGYRMKEYTLPSGKIAPLFCGD